MSEHHLIAQKTPLKASNACAALLVLENGRYLMQLRDNKPGIWYPDHWGLFGGGVEDGEDSQEALIRELNEELGFVPRQLRYFSRFHFDFAPLGMPVLWRDFYEVPVTEAEVAQMRLGEGSGLEAVSIGDLLLNRKVTPYDSFALWMHHSAGLGLYSPNLPRAEHKQ
ncbi:NUDIX domain-containing protein [Magnetospirillum sp. 64-120]|uniref:NUDIX domain-containing protein n=1 Tax=Magnetospirillum sp. 64-120 TaxID=1895778 RepID=UPI00092BA2D1|nr:NUDIX domain-containing protein [Magnetospirillum sp. 64-120]OJX75926.1 MAG: hypothetical protein BGO92_15285 [Magnetospirillum sp. 64-120]